jgi:pimeloyl-ACP methyl ester carboxylesterase
MRQVTEGVFSTGVPYLRTGQGPPLLMASGLSSEHANPTGVWRRMAMSWVAPFAEHFTVYLANRRPGLEPGTTMADLAADYANGIRHDIGEQTYVHGTSTGGSIALQLAIDHPDLVGRLVVSAAACRLSDEGRSVQRELLRLTEAGDARGLGAFLMGTMAPGPLSYPARGIGWLAGRMFASDDPSDTVAVLRAEDAFDAEPDLGHVQASTLVLGGTADAFYSEDLFRRTADRIPDGRAVIFSGKSHMYVAGSAAPAAVALGFLVGG